jgi:hypothetical protein
MDNARFAHTGVADEDDAGRGVPTFVLPRHQNDRQAFYGNSNVYPAIAFQARRSGNPNNRAPRCALENPICCLQRATVEPILWFSEIVLMDLLFVFRAMNNGLPPLIVCRDLRFSLVSSLTATDSMES